MFESIVCLKHFFYSYRFNLIDILMYFFDKTQPYFEAPARVIQPVSW